MRERIFSLSLFLCLAAAVEAADLDVVTVAAPAIHCKFDTDCKIRLVETKAAFSWPSLPGQGFLRSRTWPAGQPGTPGAALHAYLYRIDVENWQGSEAGAAIVPCVSELRIPFGPVAPVDYDGNGDKDQVFVITQGGPGSVKPVSATQSGNQVIFKFFPPVCGHITPGKGQSTFLIGLASTQSGMDVAAKAVHDLGPKPFELKSRAPKVRAAGPGGVPGGAE